MRSDAFGNTWRVSEKIGISYFFGYFFKHFQMALRVLWSVSNITASFHMFLDVLDNFSYLLSSVIYRGSPLRSGSIRARFGVDLHRFGINLGSLWSRFGIFGIDSGSIRRWFRVERSDSRTTGRSYGHSAVRSNAVRPYLRAWPYGRTAVRPYGRTAECRAASKTCFNHSNFLISVWG